MHKQVVKDEKHKTSKHESRKFYPFVNHYRARLLDQLLHQLPVATLDGPKAVFSSSQGHRSDKRVNRLKKLRGNPAATLLLNV